MGMVGKLKQLSLGKKIGLGIASFVVLSAAFGGAQPAQNQKARPLESPGQATEIKMSPAIQAETTEVKFETETEVIPYSSSHQNDATLAAGTTKVAIAGVNGVRTIVYEVTYVNGVESSRKETSNTVTKAPVSEVIKVSTKKAKPTPAASSGSGCDSNYSGCVPIASDVDCAGGSGNGPAYVTGPVNVIGSDIYGLDSDDDGIACE